MASAVPIHGRATSPFDVSVGALYLEDRWREPFAWLRANMPVSWCPDSAYGPYWSVATYAPLAEVELAPSIFSSSYAVGNVGIADPLPGASLPNFIALDPPRHTEQRRVIAPAFNPSQMAHRERQVRDRTVALFDALPVGETFDWVDRVAIPLTIGMLCALFDFPVDEAADLKRWSDLASDVRPDKDEAHRQRQMAGMQQMLARFDALMDERRRAPPQDDLLSRMVHSDAMGGLPPLERIGNIVLLTVGGNDTTRNSMSGLVEALSLYPAELDRLRDEPALIDNAAQEIVRWQSPVSHMRRTALADYELAGQTIRKGEKVILWYLSANRDEATFPDGERFDVGRPNARRHLAFGHGVHRCVGARLAEIQVGALIAELLKRRWRIEMRGAPTRLPSPMLHGFAAMPVAIAAD